MQNRSILVVTAVSAVLSLAAAAQTAAIPVCCATDFEKVELANPAGVAAELARVSPDQGGPAVRVTFAKTGEERRFVALETRPREALAAFKALDLRYRLAVGEPLAARFAVLAYERGGGAWFRSGNPVAATQEMRDCRFSLQGLRQAAFSQDASGQLEWDQVEKLWVGFLIDGAGKGSFELSKILLTSEPYRPTEPVSVFARDAAQWSVGADPAVTGKEMEVVEADGTKCLRLRFHFPGGRHMYFVPTQAIPEMEYSAYAGLRLTYRATTPAGVKGLLVSVFEGSGQFVATPAPEATGAWTTVTVPWASFPLGGWSKDENGRLDVDAIAKLCVGAHGTATGDGGDGEILIKGIEVVPAAP